MCVLDLVPIARIVIVFLGLETRNELLQEDSGCAGSSVQDSQQYIDVLDWEDRPVSATSVAEIVSGLVDVLEIAVMEGHSPELIMLSFRSGIESVPESVARSASVSIAVVFRR